MTQQGFVKMPRGLREWSGWAEATPAHRAVLQELLFSAEWRAVRRRGRWVLPGQCLTSQRQLADACNCSRRAVRRALKHWDEVGMLNRRQASGQTLVTILMWNRFQGPDGNRAQDRAQGGPAGQSGNRAQGRAHRDEGASEPQGDAYDNEDEGAGPEAGPPENAPKNAGRTRDRTHQGAYATEKKFKEVKNPPSFGTFSSPHEATAVPENPPVAVPDALRRWLEGLNGARPEETLREFWSDVRRRAEDGHRTAVACALRELAQDPPDAPAALVSYWEKIVERHVYQQERDQAERKEQERNRRERRERDGADYDDPPDIDWDGIRDRIASAPANSGASKAGKNVRDEDGGSSHTGGSGDRSGSQTTLDGGTENEDGSVTEEIGDDDEIPF